MPREQAPTGSTERPGRERLSLDELLVRQQSSSRATVEEIKDDRSRVKVTPWVLGSGCLCHLAMTVPRSAIESVVLTGDTHFCCGKILQVVEIEFAEGAALSVSEIFSQASAAATERNVHDELPAAASQMELLGRGSTSTFLPADFQPEPIVAPGSFAGFAEAPTMPIVRSYRENVRRRDLRGCISCGPFLCCPGNCCCYNSFTREYRCKANPGGSSCVYVCGGP
jgi:hypothetical protein